MHDDVAHAERPGAEAGNIAARLERIAGDLGAVENLEPVAAGSFEHDQVGDMALVGERARAAATLVPAASVRAAMASSARASATSQPKKPMPWPPSASTTSRCLRSSNAERERRATLVDALQPEHVKRRRYPVAKVLGAHADITQSFDRHVIVLDRSAVEVSSVTGLGRACRRTFILRRTRSVPP